jgi:hypothetical protein
MGLFCTEKSKTKIILWFYSGFILTRYSYLREDKLRGGDIARDKMLLRLPFGKYKGQWKTLEVYDNQTKVIIQKYVDGKRIL